jgi:hypothetical protein
MSLKDSQKAAWTSEETTAFVNFLYENRAEAGDGGNFKATTHANAAEAISHLLRVGPKKTGKMCKTKYTGVSDFITHLPFS